MPDNRLIFSKRNIIDPRNDNVRPGLRRSHARRCSRGCVYGQRIRGPRRRPRRVRRQNAVNNFLIRRRGQRHRCCRRKIRNRRRRTTIDTLTYRVRRRLPVRRGRLRPRHGNLRVRVADRSHRRRSTRQGRQLGQLETLIHRRRTARRRRSCSGYIAL